MQYHNDLASIFTLSITLILFVLALFSKGFTHDLLLEAGIFLVSVKLTISTSKIMASNDLMIKKMDHLEKIIENQRE